MKNNKNKLFIIIASIIMIFIISMGICYRELQHELIINQNETIIKLMGAIKNKYPDVDENELLKLLDEKQNEFDFNSYGIDINENSIITHSDTIIYKYLIIMIIIDIIMISLLIVSIKIYQNDGEKKLKKLRNELELINRGIYQIDLNDYNEGELSLLAHELYQVTLKLKENAINEAKDKEILKQLLSDISHQLKTPLTSISILCEDMIDNDNMDEQLREEFLRSIKKQCMHMSFLVKSLLKLSRLEAHVVKFNFQKIKMLDLIQDAISKVGTLADLKNISFHLNGDNNIYVYVDYDWMSEAISNILKNALDYSDVASKIDISYEENSLYSEIRIKDYGKGISKKDINHLFERFYKGINSNSDSIGIGLALSKQIIEANHGKIIVDSKEGSYTCFTILIDKVLFDS